jgi:hypothetical protein
METLTKRNRPTEEEHCSPIAGFYSNAKGGGALNPVGADENAGSVFAVF